MGQKRRLNLLHLGERRALPLLHFGEIVQRCPPWLPWRSKEILWMELPTPPMSSPSPPQALGKRRWGPVMLVMLTTMWNE